MSDAVATAARKRGERQRAQTRAALLSAAQRLLAENRTNVAVLEITELAEVGTGSFYNHFASKDDLFEAAVESALELQGQALDAWTEDVEDPAEVFARSFRLTGRIHRLLPELSRVILSRGLAMITSDHGLGPRALRDIMSGRDTGRFTLADPDSALLIAGGAAMAIGQVLHDDPDQDDAALTDQVTEDLLRMFGLPPDEAAAIARAPLPDVTDLLAQVLPDLPQPG